MDGTPTHTLIFLIINFYSTKISTVLGIIYPGYFTINVIETENSEAYKSIMTYWVIFAIFTLLDDFGKNNFIYGIIKFIVLVWCFHPKFNGSGII